MSGSFNFPGQEPLQYSGTFTQPFKVTTSEGREPKIAFFNATAASPTAPSALLSFFRVTTYQPIRIYKIAINAQRLTSASAWASIDNTSVSLAALGGATWPSVSQIPGSYGTNAFNNTVINWNFAPTGGQFVWTGPLYVSPNIQFQLTATVYATYAVGDTLTGNATVHWDTM